MSLIALLLALGGAALADGTALWLSGSPDPNVTPELSASTPERFAPPAAWGEADHRALAHLQEELSAVVPLKDEFDGELQIMRRLEGALGAVDLVRAEDRDLAWRALVFQGYAVHRYFQDTLASDPAAQPWRQPVGTDVAIAAWVRAIALHPERVPTSEELPDEPQRVAFKELRAWLLLQPPATVLAQGLPPGASLLVDGRPTPTARALVPAGVHDLALAVDGAVVQRLRVDLAPGATQVLPFLAPAAQLSALAEPLDQAEGPVLLAPEVVARLDTAQGPVVLVVPGRKEPRRFSVVGSSAVPMDQAPATSGGSAALVLAGGLGGAWVYDGNYVLQNPEAPETVGTANAGAPLLSVGVGGELGAFALGLGLDAALPLGEHHDLPVGEGRMRARLFPHAAIGHRLLQVAVGPLLPWHLGVGPRLRLPLPDLRSGPVEVVASYTHGIALDMTADDGSAFTPGQARLAWVGVGGRLRVGGR